MEEIGQLPRWAKVAFAARCARRFQQLFTKHWPDAPAHHIRAIDTAIGVSEHYSAAANAILVGNAAAIAYSAANSAAAAAEAAGDVANASLAYTAARLAAAAAHDAYEASLASPARLTNRYVKIYRDAICISASGESKALLSMRNDFSRLFEASRREKWDDSTPVPSSFFGPLQVPPVDSTDDPLESDEHVTMVLQAFGEPGVRAGTLAEHLLAVYKALNQYTLAKYGRHLSRGRFRRLVLLHSGVPA